MSELKPVLDSLFQHPFAPAPPMKQLERRRAQRHRRRMGLSISAAVICAGAVILPMQRTDGGRREVDTVDGPAQFVTAPPSNDPVVSPGATTLAPRASKPTVVRRPGASTTTTVVVPSREGCAVESAYHEGVETPVFGAGFGSNGCNYTATVAGGYVAHGYWRLKVMRDGMQVVFLDNGYSDSSSGPRPSPCAPVGLIQPGDEVFLYLRYGAETIADPTYVRAGPDQHC